MRSLLLLATLAFPPEFRKAYRSDLLADLEHRKGERGYGLRLFFDVFLAGLGMRFELLRRDVGYAVRMLIKAPVFTCVVGGTLAVAIAANAVILGALQSVIFAPLPYAQADQVFVSTVRDPKNPSQSGFTPPVGFVDMLTHSRAIQSAAAVNTFQGLHTVDGEYAKLSQAQVTPAYFVTLGVQPYIGRFFNASDTQSKAVISYAYWRTHYGGSASVLGKLLTIDRAPYTIIGVAPRGMVDPGFGVAAQEDIWTLFPRTGNAWGLLVTRPRSGASVEAVRADLKRLWQNAMGRPWQSYPKWTQLFTVRARDAILDDAQALWIFFAAAAAVLLIASANIANLILARTRSRKDEFAVRAALGASVRRIATQSVTETLVLCACACIAGLALAAGCMRAAVELLPENLPRVSDARIDGHVVVYVCALGIGAALVAGVLPALTAAGKDLTGRRGGRAGMTLVALEVAAAFALLVCAALLLRSFVALTSQQLGFETRHVYTATFLRKDLFTPKDHSTHGSRVNTALMLPQARRRIAALPGVAQTAISGHVPLADDLEVMTGFWLPGRAMPGPRDQHALADIGYFSREYVPLMRIPIVAGRNFKNADRDNDILVNQAFARKYFGGQSAVGAAIYTSAGVPNATLCHIIGVIADTRDSLMQQPKPTAYWPVSSSAPLHGAAAFTVVMKTSGDDPHLAMEIAALAQRYFPEYRSPRVTSLDQALADNSATARTSLTMLATLAAIALLLAVAGIYGVVAFSVERRYHEIGIRRSLGETDGRVLSRIIGSSITQAAVGIALGVVAAAFGVRAIEHQLFKTQPFDPASFALTAVLLLVCAALASAIPAWRALRIDPARTLRYD